ncbi:MAG: hypothetical protein ABIU95_03580, partial [Burkholderiales bacterium]
MDGAFDPFGGFDWNSAGSAVIQGYSNLTAVGQMSGPVTNTFYANAVQLQNTGGGNFATPNLFPTNGAGTYEYTTVAQFTEILTCVAVSAGTCVSLNANIIGGSFDIYYGTGAARDSNLVSLTGLTNGTPLISGTINPGFAGNTTVVGTGFPGPGSGLIGISLFSGAVTSTNSTFINPALVGTTATATVQ